MLTRDTYIAILEKRASDEDSTWIDNQEVAVDRRESLMADDRKYLHEKFDNAGSVQKEQSKQIGKLFPGSSKGVSKEPGTTLLKVARDVFFEAAAENELLKTASPAYLEVAFQGFAQELEKIAAVQPTTVGQMAQRNAVGQSYGKTWSIPDPDAAPARPTAGPAMQRMRQSVSKPLPAASGTSVAAKGLMSRVGGLFKKAEDRHDILAAASRLGIADKVDVN